MIDINLIRENPTLVKENMKKKFQDEKVGLVDEAYKLDKDYREVVTRASEIRSLRNKYSKEKLFTDPNERNWCFNERRQKR